MQRVLNIAAYRFVAIDDPRMWQTRIAARAAAAELKGTVLLASEGINLVLAGAPAAVRDFMRWLACHAPFTGLKAIESESDTVPFGKLRVKVKAEIIRMNRPQVRPAERRAPAVDAHTLARWLDAGHDDTGRAVVLLDTRNAFEVQQGRFHGALDWNLPSFGDFPAAMEAHRGELAGRTVVAYCTGGIRCEKAALLMAGAGIENVLQLDGGILGYFKRAGGAHFGGTCFVFDARHALDSTLRSPVDAPPSSSAPSRYGAPDPAHALPT